MQVDGVLRGRRHFGCWVFFSEVDRVDVWFFESEGSWFDQLDLRAEEAEDSVCGGLKAFKLIMAVERSLAWKRTKPFQGRGARGSYRPLASTDMPSRMRGLQAVIECGHTAPPHGVCQ